MKTLEELKAENAALETEEDITQSQDSEVEDSVDSGSVDNSEVDEDQEETEGEPIPEGEGSVETEAWLKSSDDEASLDDVPDAVWAVARRKFQAKSQRQKEESDGEIERLKTENESLKRGSAKSLERPAREDFDNSEDPDADFTIALTDWRVNQGEAQRSAERINEKQARKTQVEVDHHYERAQILAKKSKISADQYQASDLKVRQAIDSIRPGGGDLVADQLIASLGEGSEKVFYNLGVNRVRLSKFIDVLEEDPSGMNAMAYLSRLNAELSANLNRTTNAPKPSQQTNGGDSKGLSPSAAKKAYNAAHKKGDIQSAFNIKKSAKEGGADTGNW